MRQRYQPLLIFLAAVALLTVVFWNTPVSYEQEGDKWIILLLMIGFTFSVGVMLWATQSWTLRALGVFGVMAGDLALYLSFGTAYFLPETDPIFMSHMRDFARAFFLCGLPLMIWSLVGYINESGSFEEVRKKFKFRVIEADRRDVEQGVRDVEQNQTEVRQNKIDARQDATGERQEQEQIRLDHERDGLP